MTYFWLHIPTGETGEKPFVHEELYLSRARLLELINRWNNQSPAWKYWMA